MDELTENEREWKGRYMEQRKDKEEQRKDSLSEGGGESLKLREENTLSKKGGKV